MKTAILLALLTACIFAEYKYDYKTGNSYYTYESGDKVKQRGFNSTTGSTWQSTWDKKTGDGKGTDSKGNYWTYDKSSKRYHNYGTGKTCIGEGASKICF